MTTVDWALVGNAANLIALIGGLIGVVVIITRAINSTRLELDGKIERLRTELKSDGAELRTELKSDIAELRTELEHDIAKLDDRVYALAARIAPTLEEPKPARAKAARPRTA
ncbi:MAG: hypothetical protein WA006_03985 [Rhodoglobus sp.]